MNWFIGIDGKLEDDTFYGNHKELRAHMAEKLATITYAVAMSENGHTVHFEGDHRYEIEAEDKATKNTVVLARYDMMDRDEAWDSFSRMADMVVMNDNTSTYIKLVEVVEGERMMVAGSQLLVE